MQGHIIQKQDEVGAPGLISEARKALDAAEKQSQAASGKG